MQFHDRERLICHLEEKSPHCRDAVVARLPVLTPEEVKCLDDEAAIHVRSLTSIGRRRVHALLPAVRLQGPLQPRNALNGPP